MKAQAVIKVIKVAPYGFPEVVEIKNELEDMQGIVDGYIEVAPLKGGDNPACIVCNEEGKINGLRPNRAIRNENGEIVDIVFGTFFIARDNYKTGEFESLTDEQVKEYFKRFYYPEMLIKTQDGSEMMKIPQVITLD